MDDNGGMKRDCLMMVVCNVCASLIGSLIMAWYRYVTSSKTKYWDKINVMTANSILVSNNIEKMKSSE